MTAKLRVMVIAMLILSAYLLFFTGPVSAEIVDTGYRPWINGFSFTNQGDPESFLGVDASTLLGMDFHDEIFCHTGHCYGMASASVEDFETNVTSIDRTIAEAMPHIDQIQTEQSFYYITDYIRSTFDNSSIDNRAEYRKIIDRLSSGRPAVIGIYYSGGGHPGHAIVAYRAEVDGNRTLLYVYDPNLSPAAYDYEASPAAALYDDETGTFSYDNGQTFDQVRLDDINSDGVAGGKAIIVSLTSFPAAALFIFAVLRSPPRP